MIRKILSAILVLAMTASCFSVPVMADNQNQTEYTNKESLTSSVSSEAGAGDQSVPADSVSSDESSDNSTKTDSSKASDYSDAATTDSSISDPADSSSSSSDSDPEKTPASNSASSTSEDTPSSTSQAAAAKVALAPAPDIASRKDAGISAGYYSIGSGVGSGFTLDIGGASVDDGANAQIYTANGTKAQVFYIRPLGSSLYEIMCCCSGLLLEASPESAANGTNVCQGARNGSNAQKWTIKTSSENGMVTIASAMNQSFVLDVYAGSAQKFQNVQIYTANETNAQKWQLTETSEPQVALADGLYTITVFGQSNYVLDIFGGSKDNGGNLQVWSSNGTNAQKFRVEAQGGGLYSITNARSGLKLDVSGGIAANGTNVQQYTSNGTNAQKWEITGCPGRYRIATAINTDLCLDLDSCRLANGGNMQIYTGNNTQAQRFSFSATSAVNDDSTLPTDGGIYFIQSALDKNQVIDVPAANYAEGIQLQLYKKNDTDAQKFQMQKTDDGYYIIMNAKTGLVLTAKEAGGSSWGTKCGQSVIQYNEIESNMYKNYQKWKIVSNNDGSFFLQNYKGYTLDVPGANSSNGAKLQVYGSNNTAAQRFYFLKTTTSATLRTHGYEKASNGVNYWLEGTYWTDPKVSDTEFLAAAIYAEGGNQGLAGEMMIGYSMMTSLTRKSIPNMRYVIYQYGQYEICRDGALTSYLTAIASGNASSVYKLDVAVEAAENCAAGKSITLTEPGYLTTPAIGVNNVQTLPAGTILYKPGYTGAVSSGQYVLASYDGFMTPGAWERHGFSKAGNHTLQYKGHIYYYENEVWN